MTSSDGIAWTMGNSGLSADLYSVTYGDSLFIAVGDSGTIATSLDGTKWTNRNSDAAYSLSSVTYGNGLFIAVGSVGTILTSTDGIAWTLRYSDSTVSLSSVTCGDSLFVAVGGDNIITSPDGITWTVQQRVGPLICVTYGNGQYFAIKQGTIYIGMSSTDGIKWTRGWALPSNPEYATYCNSQLMIVGSGRFQSSVYSPHIHTWSDTSGWTASNSGVTRASCLYSIVYGKGIFVTVGSDGLILTSTDRNNWTTRNISSLSNINAVVYGVDQFVAVCDSGIIMTSQEAKYWTTINSGINIEPTSITFGNDIFVAVGESGSIMTSPDGTAWSARTSGTANRLNSITFNNNRFIAAGDAGTIITSSDGTTWTARISGTTNRLNSITHGNNRYAAVGDLGTIITSPDGGTWTARNSGTEDPLLSIAYGNDQFIALGQRFLRIIFLFDGMNFKVSSQEKLYGGHSIAYGNGHFVEISNITTTGNRIQISLGGITWVFKDHPTIKNAQIESQLACVTYGNNQFVAAGTYGGILTSQKDSVVLSIKDNIDFLNVGMFKINIINDIIYGYAPIITSFNHLKLDLFTISGKKIYSATVEVDKGMFQIQASGIPAGKYFMSITDSHNKTITSPFVLIK